MCRRYPESEIVTQKSKFYLLGMNNKYEQLNTENDSSSYGAGHHASLEMIQSRNVSF